MNSSTLCSRYFATVKNNVLGIEIRFISIFRNIHQTFLQNSGNLERIIIKNIKDIMRSSLDIRDTEKKTFSSWKYPYFQHMNLKMKLHSVK